MQDAWLYAIAKLYEDKLKLGTNIMRGSKKDKVLGYLKVIEEARQQIINNPNKELEKLYKQYFYDLYVIKEEDIPYSVYEAEARIAKERGYGDIKITEEYKKEKNNQIINDQKESIDKWIEYFLYDEESKNYEAWEVFWVLEGLQKLGKYDKESKKFTKRDKNMIYPFPEVEKQAIFGALNLMEEYLKTRKGPEEIKDALGTSNFKKLYEYSLEQLMLKGYHKNSSTEGIWIKYNQGSDYHVLRDSLQGYKTGWCTAAGESFAKSQLEGGDFYVYYTLDENGEYKVPRIAIRMNGHRSIAEIRGIEENQNIEADMLPILSEKLKEFPDREKYYKKEHDMALLTKIYNKVNNNIELSKEELEFLYEINENIDGFGWEKDPRIEEIKLKRNTKKDLSIIYDVEEEKIATTKEKLTEETVVFYGNLKYDYSTSKFLNLRIIFGDAYFVRLTSAQSLKNLQTIGGSAYFKRLKTAQGLENLKTIGGNANFGNLTSAQELKKLQTIGGNANFGSLTSAQGLNNLQTIGGDADFSSLKSAQGLDNLQTIGGSAFFDGLISAQGLEKLQTIGGSAFFDGLISAQGLENLKTIGGYAHYSCLTSAQGLNNLQTIGRIAFFDRLETIQGLDNLQTIGGIRISVSDYFGIRNTK